MAFSFLFLPSLFFPFFSFLHPFVCQRHAPRGAVRTETRRQKRRTSKHRERSNRRDEGEIRDGGSENVNNRAIAFRLHAQMNYDNNNNNNNHVTAR